MDRPGGGRSPIHAYAYDAARAAECADTQGRFWEYHSRLFEDRRWINNAFVRFAVDAGVADIDAFSECISDGQPVESIEADIEAIHEIGAFGTPTVIANGVLLARNPTLEDLEALLAVAEAQR